MHERVSLCQDPQTDLGVSSFHAYGCWRTAAQHALSTPSGLPHWSVSSKGLLEVGRSRPVLVPPVQDWWRGWLMWVRWWQHVSECRP